MEHFVNVVEIRWTLNFFVWFSNQISMPRKNVTNRSLKPNQSQFFAQMIQAVLLKSAIIRICLHRKRSNSHKCSYPSFALISERIAFFFISITWTMLYFALWTRFYFSSARDLICRFHSQHLNSTPQILFLVFKSFYLLLQIVWRLKEKRKKSTRLSSKVGFSFR